MAYANALDAYKDFGRKSGNLLMGLGQYFGSKGGPKVNEQFATAKPVGADNLPYVQDSMQDFWLASMGLPTSAQLNNQFMQQGFGFQNQRALQKDEFEGRAGLLEKEFTARQQEELFKRALDAGYTNIDDVPWKDMQKYIEDIRKLNLEQMTAETDLSKVQAKIGPSVAPGTNVTIGEDGYLNYNVAPHSKTIPAGFGTGPDGKPTFTPERNVDVPPRRYTANDQNMVVNPDGSITDMLTGITANKLSVDKDPPQEPQKPPLADLSGPKVSAKPEYNPYTQTFKDLGRDVGQSSMDILNYLGNLLDPAGILRPKFNYTGRPVNQWFGGGNPSRAMSAPAPSIRKLTPEELLQYSR